MWDSKCGQKEMNGWCALLCSTVLLWGDTSLVLLCVCVCVCVNLLFLFLSNLNPFFLSLLVAPEAQIS